MTERLSHVEERIASVQQLSAVISAMRGVAAARSREARRHLDAIRTYALTIGDAIGRGLTFLPSADRAPATDETPGCHAVIALCAEQGFAGSFSSRILEAAQPLMEKSTGPATLLLLGDRGLNAAEEAALSPDWSAPMIAHPEEAAALANRIVEALYERLGAGRIVRVTLVHAVPGASGTEDIVEKRLIPFDFERFPPPEGAPSPLLTLPPQTLLAQLAEEYVFAELCEAVMLSFAAENEARMRAMIAARTNVDETLENLTALSRQLRQEEITSEIIELASGAAASIR